MSWSLTVDEPPRKPICLQCVHAHLMTAFSQKKGRRHRVALFCQLGPRGLDLENLAAWEKWVAAGCRGQGPRIRSCPRFALE